MPMFLNSQPGRTEYPYAHSYMRKSDNYWEGYVEDDLRRMSCFVKQPAMEYGPNWEEWTSKITDVHAIPKIFYWEATIVTDPDHCSYFYIGICNASSECVSVDARGEAGTTFGWGIIDHRVIFVTRNGKIDCNPIYGPPVRVVSHSIVVNLYVNCKSVSSGSKKHMVADSEHNAVSDSDDGNVPHAMCNHDHNIDNLIDSNFGQRPFLFDIDSYIDRIHRLTRTLPLEIIDEIARWVFTRSIDGIEEYRAVYPLTRVSHRWLDLCRQVSFTASSIDSHAEFKAALHLGSLARSDVITSAENERKPWLRSFFASSSPRHLKKVTHWICDFRLVPEFGPPADITFCIRSNSLTNISRLNIHNRRFKKWSQFAHIVFSLPQLERLGAYDLSWDDYTSIDDPPSWLRFSRRLRALHHISRSHHSTPGYLWLFFAGKPHREGTSELVMKAQDVTVLARAIKLLSVLIAKITRIVYTSDENTSYVIFRPRLAYKSSLITTARYVTTFDSQGIEILKLSLELEPRGGKFLELTNIEVNGRVELFDFQVVKLTSLTYQLSNFDMLTTIFPLQSDCDSSASCAVSCTRNPQGVFGLSKGRMFSAETHPARPELGWHYHSFMDMHSQDDDIWPGIVVPQKVYPGSFPGFAPLPAIQLYCHGRAGINIGQFYNDAQTNAAGYSCEIVVDRLSLLQTGSTAVLNILWPGYDAVWCTALPKVPQGGCLVHIITWAVKCMYQDMSSTCAFPRDPSSSDWALSKCPFEKLYLMELRHVSPTGWQPVFCLDCSVSQ